MTQGDVGTGGAHLVGDDAGLHEEAEADAPEADAEGRLEKGRAGEQGHHHR